MTTILAHAAIAPLPPLDRHPSPRTYPSLAPSPSHLSHDRPSDPAMNMEGVQQTTPVLDRSPQDSKHSPSLNRLGNSKVVVKKEPPPSPSLGGNPRHRPRKLDLNAAGAVPNNGGRPSAGPLTSRDGLGMHEVGLACLSPGFQTQDPAMREQLQRSISVRDQQRSIIESRLLKSAKGDGPEGLKSAEGPGSMEKPSGFPTKKRPPPGLSIVPPRAEQFANERVIQSAPLGQTFTGRDQPPPGVRHSIAQPSGLSHSTQVIHHGPAIQTNNRLPPITDVFGAGELNLTSSRPTFLHSNSSSSQSQNPPLPSPGFPPKTAHPMSQPPPSQFERPREYKSAEEAVRELTGGRDELLPKLVHYGGHQPPTPPSPQSKSNDGLTPNKYQLAGQSTSRRRSRIEYEADSSPPLGTGRDRMKYGGPFGEGRDSPATQKAKKEEFLAICARAWDLFHS